MFSNHFSTNLSQNALNRAVKKLKSRSIFGKDRLLGKILWLTFLGHPVFSMLIMHYDAIFDAARHIRNIS